MTRSYAARLEPLESRTLLSSAVLHDKRLIVRGDLATPNDITVSLAATKKHVAIPKDAMPLTSAKGTLNPAMVADSDGFSPGQPGIHWLQRR